MQFERKIFGASDSVHFKMMFTF